MYTPCSDKKRTSIEFSKSTRKSLEIPCHRISQQKLMSVVFAPQPFLCHNVFFFCKLKGKACMFDDIS